MQVKLPSPRFAPRRPGPGHACLPGWRTLGLIAGASLYLALPGAIKKAAPIFFTAAGGLTGLGATLYEITLLAARALRAIRHPEPAQKHERMQLKASEARP
ncbi:MAG: hypothetical protein WA791_13525 [Rhodomicrobium sp.]